MKIKLNKSFYETPSEYYYEWHIYEFENFCKRIKQELPHIKQIISVMIPNSSYNYKPLFNWDFTYKENDCSIIYDNIPIKIHISKSCDCPDCKGKFDRIEICYQNETIAEIILDD